MKNDRYLAKVRHITWALFHAKFKEDWLKTSAHITEAACNIMPTSSLGTKNHQDPWTLVIHYTKRCKVLLVTSKGMSYFS